MTDAELLQLVRAAFAAYDPVPQHVLADARAALRWREADAAPARLVETGQDRRTPVLRETGARLLTFTGGGLTVELEVSGAGPAYQLAGQLLPPAQALVRVRHTGGELAGHAEAAGQFVVEGVPAGPVSLLILPDGGSPVVTDWIRL
ncbi:hypothetical protein [uncultured Thermomonospora sp.]|uniref:hypothetical protein n=1 Tax=uncultured Thermomonospora sp. TaxID=671175 RepID=UPI00259B6FE7|nr:hypothetical protein [uncultured Thermomonospora sp.]